MTNIKHQSLYSFLHLPYSWPGGSSCTVASQKPPFSLPSPTKFRVFSPHVPQRLDHARQRHGHSTDVVLAFLHHHHGRDDREGNMFPTQFSSLEATKLPWLWQHRRNVSCNLLSFHRTYAYSVNADSNLKIFFFYKNKTSSMECNICSSPSKHT